MEKRMNGTCLAPYEAGLELTGSLLQDVGTFFKLHGDQDTWDHTLKVTSQAVRIARLYGVDPQKAEQAALLHDVSNVIPVTQMLQVAKQLPIEILDEEPGYPRILHQKLSRAMAEIIFGIADEDILNAIECHTTLKPGATLFDKVVFIADKVAWELPGEQTYLDDIRRLVDGQKLDEAAFAYTDHVWNQREHMKLVHPWLIEAREELLVLLQRGANPLKHHLLRMFDQMVWANGEIVNRLRSEEAEAIPERALRLFGHILAAEAVWLSRLIEPKAPAKIAIWSEAPPSPEHCERQAAENAEGYRRYFSGIEDAHLYREIHYHSTKGDPFTGTIIDILTHVFLHGSYHRGQIATSLRMGGLTPPETDYIKYYIRPGSGKDGFTDEA
ncbi:bis(5'-nucleosyl)-tetraphosphatase (symmetrical) YqeK [Paenibacillus sp. M1]|uniref:bis(5'-nucleosyl)-tetraphosphatase (symmetrical) n=1 Tax=Paenibacillus haidiansis TaxID=1574488 RepID=A0ABU7VQ28_9BACL